MNNVIRKSLFLFICTLLAVGCSSKTSNHNGNQDGCEEVTLKNGIAYSEPGHCAEELNLSMVKATMRRLAKEKGVITTNSGLQYRVLHPGTGAKPTVNSTVVVHYTGKLVSGLEFDSSYKRNLPAKFPVDKVISGWTEGLQLMKIGAKYEFIVPPSLAYGKRGAGRIIGPYEILIFEVELLRIQ